MDGFFLYLNSHVRAGGGIGGDIILSITRNVRPRKSAGFERILGSKNLKYTQFL